MPKLSMAKCLISSRTRNSEGILVRPHTVTADMVACNALPALDPAGRHTDSCADQSGFVVDVTRWKIGTVWYVGG